jgi:hypothetical protein
MSILNGPMFLPENPTMLDLSQDMYADPKGSTSPLMNITVNANEGTIKSTVYYIDKGISNEVTVYQNGAWVNDIWREIEFDNQEVSEKFYCWTTGNLKKLNGTYLFNEFIGSAYNTIETVTFISNGTTYSEMILAGFPEIFYDGTMVYDLASGWLLGEKYRTVTFDNQTVTDNLYTWLTNNAKEVDEGIYTIKRSTLIEIAKSIRAKKNTTEDIFVRDFANEIRSIETGLIPSGTIDITDNGTHDVTNYAKAAVNVEDKSESILKSLIDRSITHIDIPEGTPELGTYAFGYATRLVTITIPEGVSNIGFGCFYGASALTEINIPNSVTNLTTNAFAAATNLEKVIIGTGLKTISNTVFHNCYALKTFICYAETPPTLQADSFKGVYTEDPYDMLKVYVPVSAVSAYKKATNWSNLTIYSFGTILSGTYVFNSNLKNNIWRLKSEYINFNVGDKKYTQIYYVTKANNVSGVDDDNELWGVNGGIDFLMYSYNKQSKKETWTDTKYKKITFDNQPCSKEFLTWLESVATKEE